MLYASVATFKNLDNLIYIQFEWTYLVGFSLSAPNTFFMFLFDNQSWLVFWEFASDHIFFLYLIKIKLHVIKGSYYTLELEELHLADHHTNQRLLWEYEPMIYNNHKLISMYNE